MSAADFPRTADAFKVWADRECAAWPESLTERAYSAHQAMLGHRAFPVGLIDFFAAAFTDYRAANKGA